MYDHTLDGCVGEFSIEKQRDGNYGELCGQGQRSTQTTP